MTPVDLFGPVRAHTRYRVECRRPDGSMRWTDEFDNLVVTTGLNKLLDATLKTGLTSPLWYVGLKLAGTVVLGDTMATHSGWLESIDYSEGARQAFTPGAVAAGSVSNSAAKAVFTLNANVTLAGAFLVDVATKGGTTGTLYGAGDFAAPRAAISGDTISVTVTPSVS